MVHKWRRADREAANSNTGPPPGDAQVLLGRSAAGAHTAPDTADHTASA